MEDNMFGYKQDEIQRQKINNLLDSGDFDDNIIEIMEKNKELKNKIETLNKQLNLIKSILEDK
jgi:hypothetical protein